MIINENVLSKEEYLSYNLRELYLGFGFKQYKMSKFEEYDLYAKNKDFLVSNEVITFTDTDGRLLALKPDVTLSIIKNGKDETAEKLFYDEKVYRVDKGTKSFKEITQVGIENIGNISDEEVFKTLYLAMKSLEKASSDYILEITDLDIVSELLSCYNLSKPAQKEILKNLSSKNAFGVKSVCESEGLNEEEIAVITSLTKIFGSPKSVKNSLNSLKVGKSVKSAVERFEKIIENLYKLIPESDFEKIRIDFSVVEDLRYYNGIAFKGFILGAPNRVLSGGQYDNLMKKMNRTSKAIGFAVYIEELAKIRSKGDK